MKHSFILSALLTLLCGNLFAADYSFAFEGNDKQRERLNALQGSSNIPELKVKDWVNSSPLSLEDLKGKIVVLDFWATWCGPCIGSIPKNNKLAETYKDDVVIIGVCAEKGSDRMQEVVKKYGIKYPVVIDLKNQTSKAYKSNGYPDYYIIDKSGKLIVADCRNKEVGTVLKQLLKNDTAIIQQ